MRSLLIFAASFLWGSTMAVTFSDHIIFGLVVALLGVPVIVAGVHKLADTLEAE